MRYLVQIKRENSREVKQKYPNLTAPQRRPLISFEHPDDLDRFGRSRLKDIVETELEERDEIITDDVELDRREEVSLVYKEKDGGVIDTFTIDIPHRYLEEGDADSS